jgi:hypothetical protein
MGVLLQCWERMDLERRGKTAAEVVQLLYKTPPDPLPNWHSDMKDALEALVSKPDARGLGARLRSYRRRIFQGRFIDQAGTEHRAARWAVFPAAAFGRRPKHTHHTHDTHWSASECSECGECIPADAAGDSRPEEGIVEWTA